MSAINKKYLNVFEFLRSKEYKPMKSLAKTNGQTDGRAKRTS